MEIRTNNKNSKYISLQDATQLCNYSQEYLSLRARQGKLRAAKLGRNWMTTQEWLKNYLQKAEEYNNQINGKKISPPDNLPIGELPKFQPSFLAILKAELSLQNLRPVFLFGLVLVLVMTASHFGKESLRGVYDDISPAVPPIVIKKYDGFKEGISLVEKKIIITGRKVGSQRISVAGQTITLEGGAVEIFSLWQEYFDWISQEILVLRQKVKESPVGETYITINDLIEKRARVIYTDYSRANEFTEKTYFSANDFTENQFLRVGRGILSFFKNVYHLAIRPSAPGISLTKEELIEVQEKETQKIIEEIQKLKKEGLPQRETIKEVKKIIEIQPVQEITKEVIKIDSQALKQLREQMTYLEEEIAKRLYAPGGVISQTIYVTEPVRSPKIYQENGEIVLQTLGSGNVILSAATGLQLYGKQVVIESTSLLNPLVYIASNTRIGGDLTVTGSITGGALSINSLSASGNATIGGNLTVSGDLTVSGAQTYSGAASFTASSTAPALTVRQNGSGLVAQFLDSSGTSLFRIANDGSVTSTATITAASFASAATDSTVRKSGEEVFREIMPISRYDIPAQTGTTTYFRVSKYFDQNPLSSVPAVLAGATRVYKLIIKYADDIPANSSSSWRIYRSAADTTSDTFTLLGRNLSSVAEGEATTTDTLTIPDSDWQAEVKLSTDDSDKTLRIFQIFLAAYDQIN